MTPVGGSTAFPVHSPTDLREHNFELQNRITVLCDYVVEVPIVDDYSAVAFAGIAAYDRNGGTVLPGDFVKTDVNSNYVLANCSTDLYCSLVGQIVRVDTAYPKSYLERVKTRWPSGSGNAFSQLDRMPGTATSGYPANMNYANTTIGTVWINLNTR